jgi:hypothetical protein
LGGTRSWLDHADGCQCMANKHKSEAQHLYAVF